MVSQSLAQTNKNNLNLKVMEYNLACSRSVGRHNLSLMIKFKPTIA